MLCGPLICPIWTGRRVNGEVYQLWYVIPEHAGIQVSARMKRSALDPGLHRDDERIIRQVFLKAIEISGCVLRYLSLALAPGTCVLQTGCDS